MKTFLISYSYRRCGTIAIQANSLEEAKDLALEASVDNDPRNEYYSFEIVMCSPMRSRTIQSNRYSRFDIMIVSI